MEVTKQTYSEECYRHLAKSFQESENADVCTLAIFLKGLDLAKAEENETYTKRHMRIYGMLRQAMDYVYKAAPEKIESLKTFVRSVCRDISTEEWGEMTSGFSAA